MTGANVARAMQLSAPTVHEMIGRLERDGYITRAADKSIAFTPTGQENAETIVPRHRLIERFLTDVLGIPWDEVHEEAERLEHAMSPVLEERMRAAIGNAKTCPHGHPIQAGRADRGRAAGRRRDRRRGPGAALRERGRGPAHLPREAGLDPGQKGVVVDQRRRGGRLRGRRRAPRRVTRASPRRSRSSPTRHRRRGPRCPSSSCSGRTGTGAERGLEREKEAAARAAAALVADGQRVGLGTGSTVAHLLPALAERGLRDLHCVATSPATAARARELGLPVEEFERLDRLDVAIDGADQVDPDGWLVKGGGGAHTREKIVAAAADRFVVIVDRPKVVDRLTAPIPLELLAFGLPSTLRRWTDGAARRAPQPGRGPDRGLPGARSGIPTRWRAKVRDVPGVVDHGLFPPELTSDVLIAGGAEAEHRRL